MRKKPALPKFSEERMEALQAFTYEMRDAKDRCLHVAMNEKLLGYYASWQTYTDIANEVMLLSRWLSEVMP